MVMIQLEICGVVGHESTAPTAAARGGRRMSNRKHMWGCWIVWNGKARGGPEWMWDSVESHRTEIVYYPAVFTDTRREIMPLVNYMRGQKYVTSAKPVKVPMPEGP